MGKVIAITEYQKTGNEIPDESDESAEYLRRQIKKIYPAMPASEAEELGADVCEVMSLIMENPRYSHDAMGVPRFSHKTLDTVFKAIVSLTELEEKGDTN